MTAPYIERGLESQEEERAPEPNPEAQQPTARGPLLDLPEGEAAKEAKRLWDQHKWFHKCKAGESRQHGMWRNGTRFAKLVKEPDTDLVKIVVPSGLDALPPTPNKVEESIHNAISIIMSDPPRLEAEPAGDTAQDRDAAQFATRFLMSVSTESGLNLDRVAYGALDIGATYSSGFAEVCYSPTEGGYVPLTIKARPSAQTVETAEMGEMPDGSLDSAPFVTRYVMPDQSLSESPKGAQMTWQPGLTTSLLNSNEVRFLPRKCGGIADAHGVVIARFTPLGMLKAKYERVAQMSPEELHELAHWTVDDYKRLLPEGYRYEKPSSTTKGSGRDEVGPDDEQLICTLTVYYKSHPRYPKGCYAVFGAGKYRLHEAELWFEDEDGRQEKLDIPLAQMVWEIDEDGYDPYGSTPVRRLGPMDEMRATQYAAALEYLYRFSRPRPVLPMGSTVQPEDLADRDRPLFYNPQGKPEWETLPDFPQMGMQLIDRIDREMDNTIGIQGPALGQVAGSVRSAEQQKTLIEQSNVALTALRNNAQDFIERLGRLVLQQARAHLTVPTLMSYRGQDGAYQVQEFTRADLGSTRDVRVQRGSFTMLTPTAKNEVIGMEMQLGGITPQEAGRLRRDNISALIGAQDNPHVLRVRRQLQAWRKGPPPGLADAQPQMGPDGQPAIDPMTGQPVMIDPVQQAGQQVFALLPADEEQEVAMLRHLELREAVAEMEFYAFPPGWGQALIGAYLQARQAAGIQTIAEQQQAMAAQQQAQAQQQQQQEQGKREERQSERQEDRRFQLERDAIKSSEAQEREATRMAMRSQGVA